KLVDYYSRSFPAGVDILPFETIQEGPDAYVAFVCKMLDTQQPRNMSMQAENAGYNHSQILLARFLNRFFRSGQNPNGILPNRLPLLGRTTPRRLLDRPLFRRLPDRPLLRPEVQQAILTHF